MTELLRRVRDSLYQDWSLLVGPASARGQSGQTFAIQLGVSILLSLIAGALSKPPESSAPLEDQKPTPTVERGSPIPLVIGRDMVAPMVLWAGDRTKKKEAAGGGGKGLFGGGGEEPEQTIWFEQGWHGLCVGPARRLWRIKENGKVIFKGPIDSTSHPSGTEIDLGKVGRFAIYWGEGDQEANTILGDEEAIGVTSRWPYLCYVHWTKKRLGVSPTWGRLTYDVEVLPFDTALVASGSWFPPTFSLYGDAADILTTTNTDASSYPPVLATIEVDQKNKEAYKPGGLVRIEGNSVPDGDYKVSHVTKVGGNVVVHLSGVVSPLTSDVGTIQAYRSNEDDGANAAHVLYQIMFVGSPHGMGLDVDLFDMASLENIGVLCKEEELRVTLIANEYKTAAAAIADLLLDIGVFIVQDPTTGKYTFVPIREEGDIAELTDAVIVGDPLERSRTHIDTEAATRKLFEFRDRNREYSVMPITIDNDGRAHLEQIYGLQKIRMPSVRDFTTAAKVAQRRDQESYSNSAKYKIRVNREGRILRPGRYFSVPGVDLALLLMEVDRRDSLSSEVELSAIPNFYGIQASEAVIEDGGGILPEAPDTDEDQAIIPLEIPQELNITGQVRFGVPRIRTDPAVGSSVIFLSPDDVTFTDVGEEGGLHTGGELAEALAAEPGILDQGPIIDALGPDIADALDLSAAADEAAWRLGRNIAVISDGINTEIVYLRWLEALGGDQYRMREMIRGRLGTPVSAFAAGTPVIIFDEDELKQFTDLVLQPATTTWVKSLPVGNAEIGLDEVGSVEFPLYGLGVRPVPPTRLVAGDDGGAYSNSYHFPNDVTIRWGYRTGPGQSSSGAGEMPAGDAVLSRAPVDGTTIVRILDPADDSVVRETLFPASVTSELVYTQEQIKEDFDIDPGFTPSGGRLNFRSAPTSPTPSNPSVISLSCGGNPGGGDWTGFTPATLDGATAAPTLEQMTVSTLGARGMLFLADPGQPSTAPTGAFLVRLKITDVFDGGASFQPLCCAICRFNSDGELLQAQGLTPDDASALEGADIRTFSGTIASWSGWGLTDRIGVNVAFKDTGGGGATTVEVELDSGESYVENADLEVAGVDFKVQILNAKGSLQSTPLLVTVENLGGTAT